MPRPLVRRRTGAAAVLLTFAAVLVLAPSRGLGGQALREQTAVVVDGNIETWQLVWDRKAATVCGPNEISMAITCPCSGWAYAERGKLSLVRSRGGRELERMDLGPLFLTSDNPDVDPADGSAYLQRWPLTLGDLTREENGDPRLLAEIGRRPAPPVMRFADYDRHGAATEFLLQVGTLPCGKHQFAAIGVTKRDPHLHALASISHSATPLIMPIAAWQALLTSRGPSTISTWACGDHGSESRIELVVSANDGAIHVRKREFSCPGNGAAGKLLSETDE